MVNLWQRLVRWFTGRQRRPDELRIAWPPPRRDPDREPSHPGGFLDGRDEGFWQRWIAERERIGWLIYLEEERDADYP